LQRFSHWASDKMCCRSATQSVIGNPKQTCQTLNYSLIKFGGGQTVTGLKFAKIGNFWYKFSPKGYIRLSYFFYKIWPGAENFRSAASRQISPLWH